MSQTLEMPSNYLRCTAAEGECPLRETCLRSKVHREADYSSARGKDGLWVVNLWNAALNPLTTGCKEFREVRKRSFACGFKHLFDPVPLGLSNEVRGRVEKVFSCRRNFFYSRKGKFLVSPEEQERIARIFKACGVNAAPVYDEMVEAYDWS